MADIPRLSNDLNRTLEKCGLTADGAKYVKMAIDPFHDAALDVVGLPDSHGGNSIVYDIKKNLTVDKGAIGAVNWDCHINFTPAMFRRAKGKIDDLIKCTSDVNENFIPDLVHAGLDFGDDILRICSTPTGPTNFTFVPGDPTSNAMVSTGILDSIGEEYGSFEGSYRLIGFAYEVHNTTANLNKQGAVTCYRNNVTADINGTVFAGSTGAGNGAQLQPTTVIQGPPTSVEQAKLIGGVTYSAKDGALIPCPLNPSHCKAQKFAHGQLVVLSNETAAKTAWAPTSCYGMGGTPQAHPDANSLLVQAEFMQTGAYFTGLSPETTLEVTMRAFVEFFPASRSPLFSLSHPAPADDPLIDKCLAEISSVLLPGYPVSMNAKGDFFKAVLGAAKKVARVGKEALGIAALVSPRAAAANSMLNMGIVEARDVQRAVKKDQRTVAMRKLAKTLR